MRHQTISFIKSGVRILGYLAILGAAHVTFPDQNAHLAFAAIFLIISEVLGIVEEIGHE